MLILGDALFGHWCFTLRDSLYIEAEGCQRQERLNTCLVSWIVISMHMPLTVITWLFVELLMLLVVFSFVLFLSSLFNSYNTLREIVTKKRMNMWQQRHTVARQTAKLEPPMVWLRHTSDWRGRKWCVQSCCCTAWWSQLHFVMYHVVCQCQCIIYQCQFQCTIMCVWKHFTNAHTNTYQWLERDQRTRVELILIFQNSGSICCSNVFPNLGWTIFPRVWLSLRRCLVPAMDAPADKHEDTADPTKGLGLELVPVLSQSEIPARERHEQSLSLVPSCTTSAKPKLSTAAFSQKGDDAWSDFGDADPLEGGSVGEVKKSIFEVTCQVNGCETRILRQPNRFLFLHLRRCGCHLSRVTCHYLSCRLYVDFLIYIWSLTQTQTFCTVVT